MHALIHCLRWAANQIFVFNQMNIIIIERFAKPKKLVDKK